MKWKYFLTIIPFIIAMFCVWNQYEILGEWVFLTYITCYILFEWFPREYWIALKQYPSNYRVKLTKFKFLFRWNDNKTVKEVPRGIYISTIFWFIGYIVAAIFYFGVVILYKSKWADAVILLFYLFEWSITTGIFIYYKKKIFILRYKKIVLSNIKYFIFSDKEELPQFLGNCTIIIVEKKRKKRYATILMEDSNEVLDKVLVESDLGDFKYQTYKVYEICKVKYIS